MRTTLRMICGLSVLLAAPPARALAAEEVGGIDAAIERVIRWLPTAETEPFTRGVDSFRTYVIDVEIWHRLSVLDAESPRKEEFERETVRRLHKALDAGKLEAVLTAPGGRNAFTEMLVLARRCREHGIDPEAVRRVLALQRDPLEREIARVPVPIKALYAAYLPDAGITPTIPLETCRRTGMLANRPREIDLTLAQVYYLTHEIFAYTDYGTRPLPATTREEELYLLRVLPFLTIFYFTLGQVDVASELLGCLQAGGMWDTYGYREGLRILISHQNVDGSFGTTDSTRAGDPSAFLHSTMNALTVLLMEEARSHHQD